MPTFILFHKGNKIAEVVGANPQRLDVGSSSQSLRLCWLIGYPFQELVKQGLGLIAA